MEISIMRLRLFIRMATPIAVPMMGKPSPRARPIANPLLMPRKVYENSIYLLQGNDAVVSLKKVNRIFINFSYLLLN